MQPLHILLYPTACKARRHLQRGAMFGLDARIALVIFGVLAIVTGAMLLSVMSNIKTTAIVTELDEVNKAISQYMVDTGTNLPRDTVDSNYFSIGDLLTSTRPGWKGPYMPWEVTGLVNGDGKRAWRRGAVSSPYRVHFYTIPRRGATWGATACPGTLVDCHYWTFASHNISTDLVLRLDEKVDKSDGASAGRFRWSNGGGGFTWLFFKGPPLQR